jgi:hypothetical protein
LYWVILNLSVFFFSVIAVHAEDLSFKYIHEEYKKGNYDTVSRLSLKTLKSTEPTKDPRFFFLYVSTEKNWGILKSNVSAISYPAWKDSPFYWNAIYLFMERALVLGESELLVKYGRMFYKEGKSNPRYSDATFLLAYALTDLKNISEATRLIDDLEKQNPSPKLQSQISELKSEIKSAGAQ